jgi:hypothetical protein
LNEKQQGKLKYLRTCPSAILTATHPKSINPEINPDNWGETPGTKHLIYEGHTGSFKSNYILGCDAV